MFLDRKCRETCGVNDTAYKSRSPTGYTVPFQTTDRIMPECGTTRNCSSKRFSFKELKGLDYKVMVNKRASTLPGGLLEEVTITSLEQSRLAEKTGRILVLREIQSGIFQVMDWADIKCAAKSIFIDYCVS
ncbi:hypothetical protein BaRGS_00039031 [Batillaria attramentaria]|uniref:Uncharacterized protein n=1 Tax=Batillaria attramentaria TaxID=370345 RepID=A0ABD0J470_9CAEN